MTRTELYIDFESRGALSIQDVGLYKYIYESAQPLFMSYAFSYEPKDVYHTWRIYIGEPMPREIHEAFYNPDVDIVAFNSPYERHTINKIGWPLGPERFLNDPQVAGRYLSMPGALEEQCDIMGVPPELQKKGERGHELIKFFCVPQESTKTQIKKGAPHFYWNDWNTHPKEWNEFIEYGGYDILAERELLRRQRVLDANPLPPAERDMWVLDQKINDRGMPVDVAFVKKMYGLALKAKKDALDKSNAITGLANTNSRDQVLPWLKTRGYPRNTLRKETVDSVLKDPEVQLAPEAREVLKLRREAASTTYTKLPAILEAVSKDGFLRGQFTFMGSPRCGRWAGNAVQLHNMARPLKIGSYDFEDMDVVREARGYIEREDYEGMKEKYGNVLLVIKSLIRTVFVAPEEK